MKNSYYLGMALEVVGFLAFTGFMVVKGHLIFAGFGMFGAFCCGYCASSKDEEK